MSPSSPDPPSRPGTSTDPAQAAMPYPDPVPDLPQELVDHIIDKLHADKTALKFCSLVASTWTARSHYHLFYEVEILNETQRDAWTRLFPHPCASVVADLVRRLHIDQPSILEDIAKFSLEQFRNLVHFSLGCMPFHQRTGSELGASAMDNIRLLPTSLRGLHLGLGHTYVWHITSLCGHFQDLDDLSVRSHSFKPGRQPQETALESSPRFRGELRVAIGTDFFALTDLLQSLPNGVQFTRVNLSLPLPPGSPCKVGVWLQSVAETLTSLHIDATLQSECCGRWGHFSKGVPLGLRVTFAHTVTSVISRVFQRVDVVIDLSPLQKLTTLCLRLKPAFISPSIVAQTIESAASGISTIELTLVGPIITKNWASVDGAIAALAPRCSQPLRVTINGAQKDEESRMFPRASSMGLLQMGWRGLRVSECYLVRLELEDFREALFKQLLEPIDTWTYASDVLPHSDIISIVENFGAIVSTESLIGFLFHTRYLRPRISDLFSLICKFQDRFELKR